MKSINFENVLLGAVFAYVVGVIGFIVFRFWSSPVASNTQHWGELGDYIGGMLNPIVALAALYLLSKSVMIQRTELATTSKALADQAVSAELSSKLAAYTSLINSIGAEGEYLRAHMQSLSYQLSLPGPAGKGPGVVYGIDGARLGPSDAQFLVRRMAYELQGLRIRQAFYVTLIKSTLEAHGINVKEPEHRRPDLY